VAQTVLGVIPAVSARGRAVEILEFVQEHPPVSGWVALDDLPLAGGPGMLLEHHFVRTNAKEGLSDGDADRAIALLGGARQDTPPLPPPKSVPTVVLE
jgi:hypothetical protein